MSWNPYDEKIGAIEKLLGMGCITAAKYKWAVFEIESFYCENCKKMIFDTDIMK